MKNYIITASYMNCHYILIRIYSYYEIYAVINFIEPTMQKLGLFLVKLLEWEAFGIQLLPENKTYLVAVCSYVYS